MHAASSMRHTRAAVSPPDITNPASGLSTTAATVLRDHLVGRLPADVHQHVRAAIEARGRRLDLGFRHDGDGRRAGGEVLLLGLGG